MSGLTHKQMSEIASKIALGIDEGYGWVDVESTLRYIGYETDEMELPEATQFEKGFICALVSTETTVVDCNACTCKDPDCENCPLANC
jgi:hypothetical protein